MADRSVKVTIGANVTGLQSGLKTAAKSVDDFAGRAGKAFEKNRQSLDQLSGSALKVGAGLTAVTGFAVKAAMDWESAWTGVLKTVDGTSAQLNLLEGDLRDLAKTTGFAHAEVAAVAEAAGQLGISTDGIADFTETMLALGVSTNLGAEEAATGLAHFRNIMGSSESDVARMGATIVGLGNNFATTEREILEMSMRLAGAGRQAGLTESDVMGIAASMSSVGIEAEAGGTAMSLTMKRIGKEVDSNGSKLETFARVAGMSADEFSSAWKDDAGQALTSFIGGLDKASQSGESVNNILTDLGITGIRESDAILRLSGNVEGLADALSMSASGWDENAALMAEAEKFYGTTAQKSKQAWASIKDSAIDVGDDLLPLIAGLMENVAGLADAFGELPGPVKSGVGALTGVAGVSLLAVGGAIKLVGAIQDMKLAFDALDVSGGKAKGVIGGVGKAAGIAAIAAGIFAVGEAVTKRNPADMQKLTKDLEELGKSGKWVGELEANFGKAGSGKVVKFGRDIRNIGDAIEDFKKHGDDQFFTRFGKHLGQLTAGGVTGPSGEGGLRAQADSIKDMDAAFVSLARNDPEAAIKSFERIRDAAVESGRSADDIAIAFPNMTEIIRSSSEAMGASSDSAEVLSGNLSDLAPAAQVSAEEMAALRDAAAEQAGAFMDFGSAVESSGGSISGFTAKLAEQAKSLREFTANAIEAGERGLDEGLMAQLRAMGPEGAVLMAKFANASKAEIDKANAAYRSGEEAVLDYVGKLGTIPTSVKTTVKVEDSAARAKLAAWKSATDTTLYVKTILTGGKANANGGIYQYADGGFDDRGRSVSRVPQMRSGAQGAVVWGEPETGWEAYISGKPGMESRNQAIWLEAGKRLGMVDAFAAGGISAMGRGELLRLQQSISEMKRDLAAKVGKGKNRRLKVRGTERLILEDELREARLQFAEQSQVQSQIGSGRMYSSAKSFNAAQDFKSDAFELDKLSSPAAVERHLAKRVAEMSEFTSVLGILKGRGASPWLLNEFVRLGPSKSTIRAARKFVTDHQALLRVNALSTQADQVSAAFGSLTTSTAWGQSGGSRILSASQSAMLIDYSKLAAAIAASPVQLVVDGRQAGVLVQAGSNHNGGHA